MGKEEDKNKIDKSKCNHGIGGSCLNCIPVSLKENNLKKKNCNHPPNGKCVNCLGSEFVENIKHISFDAFIEDRILKYKGVHPQHPNAIIAPHQLK